MEPRIIVDGQGASAAEWATIGHMRGWCHNVTDCAICAVERRLESVISG